MADRNEFQDRIGVGERQHRYGKHAGQARTTEVIREEGPGKGQVGGVHVEHWDGHVDAHVTPAAVEVGVTTGDNQ